MNKEDIKKVENKEVMKEEINKALAINPEELLVSSEEKVLLLQKAFTDLTEEDLKNHQSFPAKVYQDEYKVGFGRSLEVKKVWIFAMKVAPTVVLTRTLTEDEMHAIRALNPKLISNKAIVEVPAKCLSGVTEDGRRFFRIMAALCHSVYYGTSRKQKNNNGFLSNLQVTNLVINNRNVKTNPELKKVEFVDVNNDLIKTIDVDYTDDLVNSNEDF